MNNFYLGFDFFIDAFKGASIFFVHKDLTAKMINLYYSDTYFRLFLLSFSCCGFFFGVLTNCFFGFFLNLFVCKRLANVVNKNNKVFIFASKIIPHSWILMGLLLPISGIVGPAYSLTLGYFNANCKKLLLFIFLSICSYNVFFFLR